MSNKSNQATAYLNAATYKDYLNRLVEIATNVFDWKNLPESIDERFLEKTLLTHGWALYFNDPVVGDLVLPCTISGKLDVYENPIQRRAHAVNGYQRECTNKDSVIIWNNYIHEPSMRTLELYARRLYEIERTIDVNVMAQKTPVTILCDDRQLLTIKNYYKQYVGNEPVVIGDKGFDLDSIKRLDTAAPYVADKLQMLKRQIWLEALSYCGVENSNTEKAERLISTEVTANLGNVEAQRYIRLNARRQAAKEINKMFGTNIEVNFRQTAGALSEGDTVIDGPLQNDDDEVTDNG